MSTLVKRSSMTLFSDPSDAHSHQVRMVLAEKGITVDIFHVEPGTTNEDLLQLNPSHQLPTLVDRDLVLMHARIIMEYLDERFPHPPLLPVYPIARAKSRLLIQQIHEDWYPHLMKLQANANDKKALSDLMDQLLQVNALFGQMPFFLSQEFSMVDCCIAPLLWRLQGLGITWPKGSEAIQAYMHRVFERNSFQASLSEIEFDMVDELEV